MKKKERLVSIIMATIISIAMGALAAYLVRSGADAKQLESMPPAPVMFITSILESVTAGIILVLILPMGKWGRNLAAKAGATPPGAKFTLLNCLPVSVISSILVSAVVSFISIAMSYSKIGDPNKPPLPLMWLSNWGKLLPLSIIVSYVLAVVISPFVVQAVGLNRPPVEGGKPE